MKNYKYTSLDRILARLKRFGVTDLEEGDIIEWVGEALEGIGTTQQYQEAVAFIEVVNGQAPLPSNYHAIIQIARNQCFQKKEKKRICIEDVVVEEPVSQEPEVAFPVILDCQGQPITDYNLAYYRPYFDFGWGYVEYRDYIRQNGLTPVRLATSNFSDTLICQLEGEDQCYYSSDSDEYTVIDNSILRFNFQEGQIGLSFLRQPLDERGYPMIPDDISFIQAITYYILWQVQTRDYYAGRAGAKDKMDDAEGKWQWYCGQASEAAKMPNGIDEWENLKEQQTYFIPRTQQYQSFFNRLGRGKNDRYNSNYRPTSR